MWKVSTVRQAMARTPSSEAILFFVCCHLKAGSTADLAIVPSVSAKHMHIALEVSYPLNLLIYINTTGLYVGSINK